MDINSTDDEKYEEIKDREITIVKWDESKEEDITITNTDMTVSSKAKEYMLKEDISHKNLYFENLSIPVHLTNKTLKESMHIMNKMHQNSMTMLKLLTVIEKVADNAILIDIEKYRHSNNNKTKLVDCNYQYLSAFYEDKNIYPVKITIEKHNNVKNSNMHMIITIGQIKKEDLSLRVHPSDIDEESVVYGESSFTISIQEFIKYFNNYQSIIIKNLPDKILTDTQQKIKNKVISHDLKVAVQYDEIHNQMYLLKQQEKALENERYNYNYDNCNDYDDHDDDFDLDL